MNKKNYFHYIVCGVISLFALFYSPNSLAWTNELSLGLGGGREIDQDYNNTIVVLNGKFYKFPKIDQTLIATLDASVSYLHAETSHHNSLFAAAISPALRAYFVNPERYAIKPYLEVSSGPALISAHQLGEAKQGSLWVIQSTLGGGLEFGNLHHWDLNFHFAHYCNAGLARPNQGFDFPFIISIGYLW